MIKPAKEVVKEAKFPDVGSQVRIPDVQVSIQNESPEDRATRIHSVLEAQGRNVTVGDVALALLDPTIDEAGEKEKAAKKVRYEVWDKKTPINGVAPDRILARPDYTGGEIYLVYVDDKLVFLQPHAPDSSGFEPMSRAKVTGIAEKHAGDLVTGIAAANVAEKVAKKVKDRVVESPTAAEQLLRMQQIIEQEQRYVDGPRRRRPFNDEFLRGPNAPDRYR